MPKAPLSRTSKSAAPTLAEKHLGIIAGRCLYWWRYLAPSVRSFYDPEDMIGDVVVHVLAVQDKYSPDVAKESTWVYRVADNKCKSLLLKHSSRKACPRELVAVEDAPPEALESADAGMRMREARDAVERVIELGSGRVADLVEFLLYSEGGRVVDRRAFARDVAELRVVAARCGTSLGDFLVVRHAVPEAV